MQWVTRFLLGGLIVSATPIEKHERDKKRAAGIPHTIRGRLAAALDARGAAMGTIALAAFGLLVWRLLPRHNAGAVLTAAIGLCLALAVLLWRLRKLHVYRSLAR